MLQSVCSLCYAVLVMLVSCNRYVTLLCLHYNHESVWSNDFITMNQFGAMKHYNHERVWAMNLYVSMLSYRPAILFISTLE